MLGSPAKIVRSLTSDERQSLKSWAEKYVVNAAYCLQHAINVGGPLSSAQSRRTMLPVQAEKAHKQMTRGNGPGLEHLWVEISTDTAR